MLGAPRDADQLLPLHGEVDRAHQSIDSPLEDESCWRFWGVERRQPSEGHPAKRYPLVTAPSAIHSVRD
jgi:hypothetical protein